MRKNTVKRSLTRQRRSRTRRIGRVRVGVALVARFVSGMPLDGRRHSNATFWQPGTRRVGVPTYLVTWRWWLLAAGWQRAGIRLTAVSAAAMAVVGVIVR